MKTIGTDISLDVCKDEGYIMMQYDARKKFNPDTDYRIFCHYPKYLEEESGGQINNNDLIIDVYLSFNDIKEIYLDERENIDSFAETNIHVNFENPDYYDMLNLASDINAYCGLE